jgi:oxygen-independent coproporphyrinogen-3 oxidase
MAHAHRDSEDLLEHFETILPRYDRPAPRYTSYPTAPVWGEAYGPDDFLEDLGREDEQPDAGLSIYVHVPFCRSLCHFCACNRVITHDSGLPEQYVDTLRREVDAIREAIPEQRSATQQHWGGGTPTHLSPEQIRRVYRTVTDAFPMRSGAEISIEVDPRVTTPAHVEALRECGFNRISMGVQDFEPRVQEAIHRIQPVEETTALVKLARSSGFESVNFDLIYGLPYQTEESFNKTLDRVLAIGPDRLALYSYAHVTWVAKQQRGFERKDLPDARRKLGIMLLAIRRLLEAGYQFIGLDHFARPDDELAVALRNRTLRRNFMGHTTQAGVDLIGFGPSAISELRASYAQAHRDLPAWRAAVEERGLATARGFRLSADDLERRWLISRLICLGEVDAADYRARFGADFSERYRAELEKLAPAIEDDLIELATDGSLQVTALGRLLVRNLAMVFDRYLPEPGEGRPRFSRAV